MALVFIPAEFDPPWYKHNEVLGERVQGTVSRPYQQCLNYGWTETSIKSVQCTLQIDQQKKGSLKHLRIIDSGFDIRHIVMIVRYVLVLVIIPFQKKLVAVDRHS